MLREQYTLLFTESLTLIQDAEVWLHRADQLEVPFPPSVVPNGPSEFDQLADRIAQSIHILDLYESSQQRLAVLRRFEEAQLEPSAIGASAVGYVAPANRPVDDNRPLAQAWQDHINLARRDLSEFKQAMEDLQAIVIEGLALGQVDPST